jgi:hypothetical protein
VKRALLALALAACGTADDIDFVDAPPGCVCDAGTSLCPRNACTGDDAGADAPPDAVTCLGTCSVDAGGTLPVNAPCEPTLDECMAGLTCRIRAAHDGICRATGALAEGAACTSVDQCGSNMACLPTTPGMMSCMVVCDVAAPAVRCDAGQTCTVFWGADTGVCT